jgi:hypothetical protein
MALTLLKEYELRFQDDRRILIYAATDLPGIDLRTFTAIHATGNIGVGTDGVALYDGHTKQG